MATKLQGIVEANMEKSETKACTANDSTEIQKT